MNGGSVTNERKLSVVTVKLIVDTGVVQLKEVDTVLRRLAGVDDVRWKRAGRNGEEILSMLMDLWSEEAKRGYAVTELKERRSSGG